MSSSDTTTARPVILINGIGTNFESMWRRTGWVEKLESTGRTVIGVDLPGHGQSKDAVGRDAADLVIEESSQHGSVDGIGFSAGAWALLIAASERPELFGRIAALGAADMVLTAGAQAEAMQRPIVDGLRSPAEPTDNPLAMGIRAMVADAGNDRASVADYLESSRRYATIEGLAGITAATLVVAGAADMAGPSDLVHKTIPNSECFVVEGTDHFDIPTNASCIEAVQSFINRSWRPRGTG